MGEAGGVTWRSTLGEAGEVTWRSTLGEAEVTWRSTISTFGLLYTYIGLSEDECLVCGPILKFVWVCVCGGGGGGGLAEGLLGGG